MRPNIQQAIFAKLNARWRDVEYQAEVQIRGPQGATVRVGSGEMINMSSNNYLGLANNPEVREASAAALEMFGFGMASVRFLSGTHELHEKLEAEISDFLQTEDTVLFASCYDANAGAFEALLDEDDLIISDELNHASIIDGVRLSKAKRVRYRHRDMQDLESKLVGIRPKGMTVIVTDGVFSMDGTIAPLREILSLAHRYDAFLFVDDSHGIGVCGAAGRGTMEAFQALGEVDLVTGTLGKALGGGVGGFATGRAEVIKLLRRSARPYIFSNPIPPHIAAGSLKALQILRREPERLAALQARTTFLRSVLSERAVEVLPGAHPIVPVMLRDRLLTQNLVAHAREKGILVSGITYPVVPVGSERIRLQVSAVHTQDQLLEVAGIFASWIHRFSTTGPQAHVSQLVAGAAHS